MNIASRSFLHIKALSRQKEARSPTIISNKLKGSLLCTVPKAGLCIHAFEQFGTLYMHNHDDKYPARPGFEPGTSRLQTPGDTDAEGSTLDVRI